MNSGHGAGTVYSGRGAGAVNVGPGAGALNAGLASGSVNTVIRHGTDSASSKTKNPHGVEKDKIEILAATSLESNKDNDDKSTKSYKASKSNHDSNYADGNEGDNMFDGSMDINKAAPKESDSDLDDFAMKFLNALSERNEDRNVTVDQFGLVPTSDARIVGKFKVHPKLEAWARHLLNAIPELTSHSKAKNVMIEDAFVNLCAAMKHMEVTPFADMDENFFYLCRDAIDDAESINFEVGKIRAHLLDLAKAYLGKCKYSKASNLDEQIEEQAKHVENIKKSLDEAIKLIHMLEAGLKSIKAHPKSPSQEKKRLSSGKVTELCQTCVEIAKNYGDKPGPFCP